MQTRNKKRSLPEFLSASSATLREKITKIDGSGRSQSVENIEAFQELTNKDTGETVQTTLKTTTYKETVVKKSLSPIIYTGKIHFHVDWRDISEACEVLLKFVNEQTSDVVPVGFDMEWPFNFSTGPQKTALIQLCAELDQCYLFHVTKLQKLPQSLMTFLNHPKIRWHGVNIKNDFRKLQRDFPEVESQKLIDQCLDLGPYCNLICSTSGRWSMERLVAFVCRMKIDKNKEVRNSKWNVLPLNHFQKLYAAIDVYISQVIYYELENRRLKQEAEKRALQAEIEEKAAALVNVSEKPEPTGKLLGTENDDEFLDKIQQMIDATSGAVSSDNE